MSVACPRLRELCDRNDRRAAAGECDVADWAGTRVPKAAVVLAHSEFWPGAMFQVFLAVKLLESHTSASVGVHELDQYSRTGSTMHSRSSRPKRRC